MNKPDVYWLDNPFDFNAVTHYPIDQPLTIRQWLDDHGGEGRLNRLPTVCVYSGRELMRAEYDQPIDGPVCFVTLPTGGDSGTNPMAMIAMVALTVFTMGAGAVTLAGLTAGMGIGANTMMVMQMGIMMAGSMLINAVFPPPGLPNSATPSTGSPTYAMQAQGNAARLGSPIPVNYGRMRIYPDFAAAPYTEFESNEQYLYQLFCIGQGENRVSDIRLDNTPIDNFAEVTTEIVPPLGKVTLFHTAVVTAPEAGGQEMSKPVSLGPYTLNDQATEVSRIAVDVVFPGGLMGVNEDNGDEYTIRVHLQISAEAIDDAGEPTGEGASIFNNVISGCTRTAIRRTLAADVTPGRYRVTVQRHTGESPSNEVTHCSLGAIKGYLVDDNEYGDVTLLAMRVRASANLSDSASRLVNVLCERLIPVWSGQGWSLPQLTRNPSWAFADAVRSRYGGDFADREIDLEGLLYLAGLFDDREDRFDGRFDTEQSLWDALGKIGQVCRSGPVRQGNMIRLIRDQHIETPAQAFGMANMSDFSVDYVMHDDRTADAVKITYWDEARDYSETTVLCQLPDDTADNPQEVTLFGCTQYEQAWREGMYLAATNRERRQMVSWTTGLEGHIPTFGDLVIINHDLLGAGQQFGGVVLAKEGAVLTLSADVKLEGEHWYLILRDRHGQPSAPIAIEQGAPNQVRALDTLPYIEEDSTREPTHYLIGQGSKVSWPVKITAITPEADNKVAIAGCIESEFVHTVDEGKIPPPLPKPKPQPPGLKIEDLRATQGGTVGQPVIFLSWAMAVGADRYQIEYSTDGRATWQPAGSGQSFINQHEFTAEPGLITCRVAAVGAVRGDWASIDVNAGSDFDTPGKVQPVLAEPFTGNALKVRWDKEPAAAQYLVEVWSHGALVRSLYLDRAITEYQYHYRDAQQDAAGRTLTVKVSARNAEGVTGAAGELTATNPPPGILDNVQVTGLLNTLMVQCTMNPDPDIRELRVYGEQQSGFTPSAGNLLAASANALLSVPVPVNTHWWVKLAWVDQWGATDLVFSGEFEAEAKQITETEIGPDSISTPMLKANSVAAGKVAADAISGREISAATTITAGSGAHQAGMNGASDTGSTELDNMRFWAGADQAQVENAPFQVLDDG
ncbi:MAG: phage tail protein, partial [Candidatus Thiodiazotropha sp. 6PLUC6]